MKHILFAALLLCCYVIPSRAQQTVQLDDHTSIVLPGTGESSKSEAGIAWYSALSGGDRTKGMAMANLIAYSQLQLDSAQIAAHYNDAEFIKSMIDGMLGKLPGVQVISNKKITQSGRKGYEMELEKKVPDDQFPYKKVHIRMLFGGKGIYLLAVYLAENVDGEKQKTAFFKSLKFD